MSLKMKTTMSEIKKNTLDGSIRSEKTGEFEEKAIETQK